MLSPPLSNECRHCSDCKIWDGSIPLVVARNRDWKRDCPSPPSGLMCAACIGGVTSINYRAFCENSMCVKKEIFPFDRLEGARKEFGELSDCAVKVIGEFENKSEIYWLEGSYHIWFNDLHITKDEVDEFIEEYNLRPGSSNREPPQRISVGVERGTNIYEEVCKMRRDPRVLDAGFDREKY